MTVCTSTIEYILQNILTVTNDRSVTNDLEYTELCIVVVQLSCQLSGSSTTLCVMISTCTTVDQ